MKCSDVAKLTGKTPLQRFYCHLFICSLLFFFSIVATSQFPFVSKMSNPKALSLTYFNNPHAVIEE